MCIGTASTSYHSECVIGQLRSKPFTSRNSLEKSEILDQGRPTPDLPGLTTEVKRNDRIIHRKFNRENYKLTEWLTGCSTENKLFCWPCVLFNTENSVWSKLSIGYNDLNNISTAIRRHNELKSHMNAVLTLAEFGKNSIDVALSQQRELEKKRHNESVRNNREILIRLIDTVLYLGNQELAFRGHDEGEESLNKGNYLELLAYLAKYDKPLHNHLKSSTVFKGTSNRIQNDLIDAIATVLRNEIRKEIEESSHIAIILDETTDVAKKSQLSLVFRYCYEGDIYERFYGFYDVSKDRTAHGIYLQVVEFIESIVRNGSKLVAQGYDGAAVMAGEQSGLQTQVRAVYPYAMYIHCLAHELNLALAHAAKQISECIIFFETTQGFASFFSVSTKRVTALLELVKKKFPQVCPTRWCFKSRLVNTVCEGREGLIQLFTSITENKGEWSGADIVMARGFLSTLKNFKFNFLLKIFALIFDHTDILFNVLQGEGVEIDVCLSSVQTALNFIQRSKTTGFEKIYNETISLVGPDEKRRRTNVDVKTQYEKLFVEVHNKLETELTSRFGYVGKIKFIELLNCKKFHLFEPVNGTFPDDLLENLKETYKEKFDYSKLKSELCVLYQWDIFKKMSIYQIYRELNKGTLRSTFHQIWLLCDLILTLPSTTVKAERSFSALKRILDYLRNTMGQERLSNLSVIAIERELLKTLRSKTNFYDLVISEFMKQERRLDFIYRQ